jgi:hypothetical protein
MLLRSCLGMYESQGHSIYSTFITRLSFQNVKPIGGFGSRGFLEIVCS